MGKRSVSGITSGNAPGSQVLHLRLWAGCRGGASASGEAHGVQPEEVLGHVLQAHSCTLAHPKPHAHTHTHNPGGKRGRGGGGLEVRQRHSDTRAQGAGRNSSLHREQEKKEGPRLRDYDPQRGCQEWVCVYVWGKGGGGHPNAQREEGTDGLSRSRTCALLPQLQVQNALSVGGVKIHDGLLSGFLG